MVDWVDYLRAQGFHEMVAHLNFFIDATFALTAVLAGWLLFVIFCPRRWAAIVDGENAFWAKRGVIGTPRSESFKRLEKGFGFKLLLAAAVFLAVMMLIILLHFRARINRIWNQPPPRQPVKHLKVNGV